MMQTHSVFQHKKFQKLQSTNEESPIVQSPPGFLKFIVLPGNNSKLIKDALLRRSHKFIETLPTDSTYHFKWQPVSYGIRFESLS
jgi:hypothetical protein